MANSQLKKKTKEQGKQKITPDDAVQKILDEMLLRVNVSDRKMYGNLTQAEIDRLYQIVTDLEDQDENYNCLLALGEIAKIIKSKNYVKTADISTKKNQMIPKTPETMPFLIKQVLFYIAVICDEKRCNNRECNQKTNNQKNCKLYTQKDIIDIMNNNGVPISHNFFSRMKTTPVQYINKESYVQPKLPIRYMGQKNNELAYAIKNLVYQAGNYDIFCDIFGGSGAATLSVDKRKDANYVYNEKNISVYNLFQVMADENKYKELINELQCLQSYIEKGEEWLYDIDFEKEIETYFNSKKRKNDIKEKVIKEENGQDLEMGYDDIVKLMKELRDVVLDYNQEEFQFDFDGERYTKEKLLDEVFPEAPFSFTSFCENFRLVKEFDRFIMGQWNMDNLYGKYTDQDGIIRQISYREKDKRFRQYRVYEYYAYFENLLNKCKKMIASEEEVRYAVAEIFHWSILTTGKAGLSPILRMTWMTENQNSISNEVDNFVKKDFESIITRVHDRIKGTICKNEDCIQVIQKYKHDGEDTNTKHNHPLFYSDSPYEATKGYESKENSVEAFSSKDMKDLILALKNTGDRFIFSCRAAKGSVNGSDPIDELKSGNKSIFKNVFNVFLSEFEEKGIKLWLLAIEKGGSLAELVKDNKISEIMITNYAICDIKENQAFKNTQFKVYDFYQFLDILIHNANV